ncbi:TPA: hypothetical protein ACID8P_006184, partial [Pseudomonas aeruginosa]
RIVGHAFNQALIPLLIELRVSCTPVVTFDVLATAFGFMAGVRACDAPRAGRRYLFPANNALRPLAV